jgi:hypothetical protein
MRGEMREGLDRGTCAQFLSFSSRSRRFWKHHAHYRIWKGGQPSQQVAVAAAAAAAAAVRPRASPQPKKLSSVPGAAAAPVLPTSSASAAYSVVPASLIAARNDSTHPRIRIVDPKTGEESYFILPAIEGGADHQQQLEEEDDDEPEPEPAQDDEPMESADEATKATAGPVSGYRCCLPSTRVPGTPCHRFLRTTNALGTHLRMSHGIEKATSSGKNNDDIYVEWVQ